MGLYVLQIIVLCSLVGFYIRRVVVGYRERKVILSLTSDGDQV